MKRFKIMGVALVAILAVSATAASGASAAEKLVLKEQGVALAPGAGATGNVHVILPVGCWQVFSGELLSNEKPKDNFASTSLYTNECDPASTALPTFQLAPNGTVTVKYKPKLAITTAGPCVFEYAKLTLNEPFAGLSAAAGHVTGKLNKKTSNPSCAPSLSIWAYGALKGFHTGSPLETELMP